MYLTARLKWQASSILAVEKSQSVLFRVCKSRKSTSDLSGQASAGVWWQVGRPICHPSQSLREGRTGTPVDRENSFGIPLQNSNSRAAAAVFSSRPNSAWYVMWWQVRQVPVSDHCCVGFSFSKRRSPLALYCHRPGVSKVGGFGQWACPICSDRANTYLSPFWFDSALKWSMSSRTTCCRRGRNRPWISWSVSCTMMYRPAWMPWAYRMSMSSLPRTNSSP